MDQTRNGGKQRSKRWSTPAHPSSLQSFSAIGDGAAEAQLTTPRSRRQVVFRAPRLDCDSDESVLAVKQQLRRDDSDARSRARGRKSRILKSDTLTLGTESLSRAPPLSNILSIVAGDAGNIPCQ